MKCKECTLTTCIYRDTNTSGEKECPFGGKIVEFNPEKEYWKEFRRQAAVSILSGYVAKVGLHVDFMKDEVSKAVKYADELIEQLKVE